MINFSFPPPFSSAGVPSARTRPGRFCVLRREATTRKEAREEVAMRLWPHAWIIHVSSILWGGGCFGRGKTYVTDSWKSIILNIEDDQTTAFSVLGFEASFEAVGMGSDLLDALGFEEGYDVVVCFVLF